MPRLQRTGKLRYEACRDSEPPPFGKRNQTGGREARGLPGIFHFMNAMGVPEAASNAGLRAQLPEDGRRRITITSRRPAGARARRRSFLGCTHVNLTERSTSYLPSEFRAYEKDCRDRMGTMMTRRLSIGRRQWSSEEPACLLSVIFRSAGVVGGIVDL